MLASLRPHSPPVFAVNSRSQSHAAIYSGHSPQGISHTVSPQMEGSGAKRYTTPPPLRPAAPHQIGSAAYFADAGQDMVEQRPSPQSRQRSWHPYMHASRGTHGPSPPMSLESGAGPSTRSYNLGLYDSQPPGSRPRSPPQRSEHLHTAPESRPHAASRTDVMGRAQPVNISALPAYPHNVERVGNIGPSRNRGRSSTLSIPHPDTNRVRGSSFIGGRHNIPSSGYDEPVPPPPRSWEEARFYRDTNPNQSGEPFAAHRPSPTLRPSSRQSSVLFAPLSPSQDSQAHLHPPPQRGPVPMAAKMANASVMPRPSPYRSRPSTPMSPLNMENLSMEEAYLPSASGMAVPLGPGQQRSPADLRGRGDYFGPGAAEWHRSSQHQASDMAGSPPSGPYTSAPRSDRRELAYRASGMMHPDGISPDSELPRYISSSCPGGPSPLHPGRGPPGALAATHHPGLARMEQIERERYAMAQHHAPPPGAYMGPGGPHEHGYQSEFAPEVRHGPGAGLPQHAVPVDRIAHSRRRRRPPYSYSSMITQAIASSSEGRMTLREIYTWISTNFSGYPMSGHDSQGWQNTVRHNLSLGKIFIKKARTAQDIYDSCSSGNPSQSQAARGKGGWWTLHPVVLAQIRSGQRTHNDEFADIERLVEIENAASSSNASGSAAMTLSTSAASVDGAALPRRASAELGHNKSLSRQRSYSDSMDPTAVEQRRSGAGHQSSTAPVSRKGSIGAGRNGPAGRSPYAPYAVHPVERKVSGASAGRDDMPSVLQPNHDVQDADRPNPYNRIRGHTIAMHETSSQYRADKMGGEAYTLTRPPSGSVSSPRPLFHARSQAVEDVEMESPMAQHRDSSLVLQEARETLVSTKHQQQQMMQAQRDTETAADAQEGAGRMAIRGLLNS